MNITQKWKMIFLVLGASAVLAFFIASIKPQDHTQIHASSDTKAMQEEVLRYIPIGSNIKDAKQIMHHNGFGCAIVVDGTQKNNNTSFAQAEKLGKQTVLSCTKKEDKFFTKIWIIDLAYKNYKVEKVSVFYRSTASDIM